MELLQITAERATNAISFWVGIPLLILSVLIIIKTFKMFRNIEDIKDSNYKILEELKKANENNS